LGFKFCSVNARCHVPGSKKAADTDIAFNNKDIVLRDLVSYENQKLSVIDVAVLLQSTAQSALINDTIFKNCYW
jgi:hypothetical protein